MNCCVISNLKEYSLKSLPEKVIYQHAIDCRYFKYKINNIYISNVSNTFIHLAKLKYPDIIVERDINEVLSNPQLIIIKFFPKSNKDSFFRKLIIDFDSFFHRTNTQIIRFKYYDLCLCIGITL